MRSGFFWFYSCTLFCFYLQRFEMSVESAVASPLLGSLNA